MKANSGKCHLLITYDNVLHGNNRGNQLSINKYEKLLGILLDLKLTFEDHHLNIAQKVNQEIHALKRKPVHASEETRKYDKINCHFTFRILPTNLDVSYQTNNS